MAVLLRASCPFLSNNLLSRCSWSYLVPNSLKQVARFASAVPAYEKVIEATDDLVDEHIFTQEHLELRQAYRKVIEKEINPYIDQWEKEEGFPTHEIFKKLGDVGLLGVNKPVEYGGLGLDYTYSIAVSEEIGSIRHGSLPMAIGIQTDVCSPALSNFGSHELKEAFLRPTITGDFVGCLGVSEVEAGSDVANIKTKAVKQGDDYVINGGKMWTTNACQADWMCILANTGGENSHQNKSLIIIPMDTPGITVTKIPNKLGMRSSDTGQSFFEDVRVPQKFRVGEEGLGFVYQMLQFQDERLMIGIASLLPMERAIMETAKYCSQRKIFGKPILDNQVVHFRLAELQTEVELLRSLIYRAAGLRTQGINVTRLASMIKLKTARLLRELFDSCLQYWGGMGYTDIEISRGFRDNRLMSIGGGADEVMLSIICKYMGTLPKPGK